MSDLESMDGTKESECSAKCNKLLRQLLAEVLELKAMISQLGPADVKTSISQEIAAIRAQGGDVAAYLKARGKEQVKASRKKNR